MVAPAAPQSDVTPTYGIRISGRLFPRRLRPTGDSSLLEAERDRNGPIAQRLLKSLPWNQRTLDDYENLKELVKCYEASLQLLELRHQEVADLLWEVCWRSLKVRVTGFDKDDPRREEVKPRLVRKRFEQAAFHGFKPDSVLSAELLVHPIDHVHSRLTQSLEQTTHRVVQSAFEAMDRLVDRSVLGLIDRLSEKICKFHFFTESSQYHREKVAESIQEEIRYMEDEWKVEQTTISNVKEVESRTRTRHEHHLMESTDLPIKSMEVEIPIDIQPIVDKVPAWLFDEARIVTGEQFREDTIEQRCQDRVWLKERVKTRKIRTHYDPAVVIDRFVLVGWGEKETRAEEKRRRSEQDELAREKEFAAFEPSYLRAKKLASGFGIASVVTFGLGQLGSSALVVLALICLVLSVWQKAIALQNAANYYRVQSVFGYLATGIGGMLSFLTGCMLALAGVFAGMWLVVLVGIILTLLSRLFQEFGFRSVLSPVKR